MRNSGSRSAVTANPRTFSASPPADVSVKPAPVCAASRSKLRLSARQSRKFGWDTPNVGQPFEGLLSQIRTSRSDCS